MININAKEFYLDVLSNKRTVLLEVRAKWSGDSHIMSKVIDQISDDFSDQLEFFYSDFDDNTGLMKVLNVNRWDVPAVYIFSNGNKVEKHTGLLNKEHLENLIANTLIKIVRKTKKEKIL